MIDGVESWPPSAGAPSDRRYVRTGRSVTRGPDGEQDVRCNLRNKTCIDGKCTRRKNACSELKHDTGWEVPRKDGTPGAAARSGFPQ